ncbi:MAG TPA: SUMF1/EgtB/PvdO family nonheme iron enzyme, partial [Burkholderiales bacterium]|nr:SUMF1/EgtB/PvdO family nonheme iron enzyme [Burkholderiales bacterium]
MTNARNQPDAATLCEMLQAARARTLAYAAHLRRDQWLGPYLKIVNPPLWELGHLGWFQEYWCLRYRPDGSLAAPMLQGVDALYNSALVPHAERWRLSLPDVAQMQQYLRDVLDAVVARLAYEGATEHLRYFVQLAVFHEEMHNEAFDYTLQTLGYSAKKTEQKQMLTISSCAGDSAISGGRFRLGAQTDDGFVFDNEKLAHEVTVLPYRMSRTAVSNAEFARFADEAGYTRRELWSEDGWRWCAEANATAPLYWMKQGADWRVRRYDQHVPLEDCAAVIHVNWYEAEAYCKWAQRRLPSEAEWEFAAATAPDDLLRKRRYPWGDTLPHESHANLHGMAEQAVDVAAFPEG